MKTYLALLRGVNVGGNGMLKMSELAVALERAGFANVHTYINSGNVFFRADQTDKEKLARKVHDVIRDDFSINTEVVVFTRAEWQHVIEGAPSWWGHDDEWKHNLLVLIPPYDMKEVLAAVGDLKPDIEAMAVGDGVLYQSMSKALFGRTTTGKLASNPIYKKMTVRNYNTTTKLFALFDKSV